MHLKPLETRLEEVSLLESGFEIVLELLEAAAEAALIAQWVKARVRVWLGLCSGLRGMH